jgi:hypothetical protein
LNSEIEIYFIKEYSLSISEIVYVQSYILGTWILVVSYAIKNDSFNLKFKEFNSAVIFISNPFLLPTTAGSPFIEKV